jgi:hypothetical protein
VLGLVGIGAAAADAGGPITFEPPAFAMGDINGQGGWTKTGPYDVAVVPVASFPAAAGYGFGSQALRLSNAVVSGTFGDQTFAPPLAAAAGESTAFKHFDASFNIGTALATQQPGLALSVSPDDGTGGRMSFLRFEDQADGVHVFFDDATDNGLVGTTATFNERDIATLDRAHAHSIRFSIAFVPGPGNDVVRIYVDGALKATGTSWENYYRYDPGQAGNHNVVPVTRTLLFREGGSVSAAPATTGNGFLVDNISYSSSAGSKGAKSNGCRHGGWKAFGNPSFRNQGQCVAYLSRHSHHAPKHPEGDQGNGHGGQNDQGKEGRRKGHDH